MSKPTGSKGRGRSRSNNSKRSIGRSNNHDSQIGRNRGNPQQMMDKYLSLARDSLSQGDRVSAENFFQHADHYQRVVTEKNEKQESRRRSVHQQNGENLDAHLSPIYLTCNGSLFLFRFRYVGIVFIRQL